MVGCWETTGEKLYSWQPVNPLCRRNAFSSFAQLHDRAGILLVGDSLDFKMLQNTCRSRKGVWRKDLGGPQHYDIFHVCQLEKLDLMHVFIPGVRLSGPSKLCLVCVASILLFCGLLSVLLSAGASSRTLLAA